MAKVLLLSRTESSVLTCSYFAKSVSRRLDLGRISLSGILISSELQMGTETRRLPILIWLNQGCFGS